MCLGPEIILPMIIGTALSAGGQMIQQGEEEQQARDRADARNAVLMDTLRKNDKIAENARDIGMNAIEAYRPDRVEERQDAARGGRLQTAERVLTMPDSLPTTADAPDIVQKEVAKRMSEALAKGKEKAKRTAKLQAFGDQWFQGGLGDTAAMRDIGVQSGFASANLGLLPSLQDIAEARSYSPVSPLGGILMGAGNMLGSATGSGYFSGKSK